VTAYDGVVAIVKALVLVAIVCAVIVVAGAMMGA